MNLLEFEVVVNKVDFELASESESAARMCLLLGVLLKFCKLAN